LFIYEIYINVNLYFSCKNETLWFTQGDRNNNNKLLLCF
jgi:hypothetical protein